MSSIKSSSGKIPKNNIFTACTSHIAWHGETATRHISFKSTQTCASTSKSSNSICLTNDHNHCPTISICSDFWLMWIIFCYSVTLSQNGMAMINCMKWNI